MPLCYNNLGDIMITFKWNNFDFTLVHFGKGVFNEDMAGHSHAKNIYELHYIIDGLRARTHAEADMEWTSENVTLTITSDKAQTIKVSVYGGEEQAVSFNKGETKTIVLAR